MDPLKSPITFVKVLSSNEFADIEKLYLRYRSDFVKWARKKHYPSPNKEEKFALSAYQRVFFAIAYNQDGLIAKLRKEPIKVKTTIYTSPATTRMLTGIAEWMAYFERRASATAYTKNCKEWSFVKLSKVFDVKNISADELKQVDQFQHLVKEELVEESPDLDLAVDSVRSAEALTPEKIDEVKRYIRWELDNVELARFRVDLAYDERVAQELKKHGQLFEFEKVKRLLMLGDRLEALEKRDPYYVLSAEEQEVAQLKIKERVAAEYRGLVAELNEAREKLKKAGQGRDKEVNPIVLFGLLIFFLFATLVTNMDEESEIRRRASEETNSNSSAASSSPDNIEAEIPTAIQDKRTIAIYLLNLDYALAANEHTIYFVGLNAEEMEAVYRLNPSHYSKLFLAIAYMRSDEHNRAVNMFRDFIFDHPQTEFADHAAWYLGLTYLKEGDPKFAKELFIKIRDNEAPVVDYSAKAIVVLDKLGELGY